MWVFRRWFELVMLLFGVLAVRAGTAFPPPVAPIHVLSGPVERLTFNNIKRPSTSFTVQGKQLTSFRSRAEEKRLRARIREGASARALAWTRWGEEQIVTLDLDGRPVLRKRGFGFSWLLVLAVLAMGLTLIGLGIASFRSPETAWQRQRRIQNAHRELQRHSRRP